MDQEMESQSQETEVNIHKQMIEERTGRKPMMGEPECSLWMSRHPNCAGCHYELPCCQLSVLTLVELDAMMYMPRDFSDYLRTQRQASEMVEKILKETDVKRITAIASGEVS